MPSATTPSEGDVIFNKASVALARSQRLVASWLPSRTAEESAHAKSEEELEKEDQETFTPVPELLGVGAPLPQDIADGSFKRSQLSSNDRLRKQLLGKNAVSKSSGSSSASSKHARATPQPASKPMKRPYTEEDSEDEGGRASSFKSRKAKSNTVSTASLSRPSVAQAQEEAEEDMDEDTEGNGIATRPPNASSSVVKIKTKRPTNSFLDDVLAEKAKKKKKKRKKNKDVAAANGQRR